MTISTGDNHDPDSEEEATYQVELEIIQPSKVDSDARFHNLLNKVNDIAKLLWKKPDSTVDMATYILMLGSAIAVAAAGQVSVKQAERPPEDEEKKQGRSAFLKQSHGVHHFNRKLNHQRNQKLNLKND